MIPNGNLRDSSLISHLAALSYSMPSLHFQPAITAEWMRLMMHSALSTIMIYASKV